MPAEPTRLLTRSLPCQPEWPRRTGCPPLQADCLPDPGDVFAFLKENDIGQEHALYYIAYATYLEARGGYAKARPRGRPCWLAL